MSDLLGTIATTLRTVLGTVICMGGTTFLFKLGAFGPCGKPVASGDECGAVPITLEHPLLSLEESSPATTARVEEEDDSPVLTKVAVALR